MTRSLHKITLAVCLMIASAHGPLAAQENKPAEELKLDEVAVRLAAIDEELNRKADETRTTVEKEAAEKRLSDPIAQSLRWSLRTAVTSSGTLDVRGALATARVPANNEIVSKAFKELEAANLNAQNERASLQVTAVKEARRQVITALQTATKAADLAPLETAIDKARDAIQRRNPAAYGEINSLQGEKSILRALRRVIDAQADGVEEELGNTLVDLKNSAQFDHDLESSGEVQAKINRILKPSVGATAKARETLEAALKSRKSKAELMPLLNQFESAVNHEGKLQRFDNGGDLRFAPAFRALVEAAVSTADDDAGQIRTRFENARNALQQIGPARASEFGELLASWEKNIAETNAQPVQNQLEKVRTRLSTVDSAAAVEALARDIASWGRETRGRSSSDQESWNQLAGQLMVTAAAWNTSSPGLLQQERYGDSSNPRIMFGDEVRVLRKRIEREIISRTLRVPELMTPPLSEKPPDAALESLADELAAKADWRRLYQVLEARGAMQGLQGRTNQDDAVGALRSFFTGQNLELAEQWPDAAQAYKEVLRATSERAPIKAAAKRLKELTRTHPDLSIAPQSPSAPRSTPRLDQ